MTEPGKTTRLSGQRKTSARALREAIDRRLSQPAPVTATIDETLATLIRLDVKRDVRVYERNPRQETNEKYAEIKESIRARGLDHMVVVTKRPGEKHYIPARGGNTRIQILHELIDAGDSRFEALDFYEIPYPGEIALLAAHLVENDQRAGLSFWESAQAIFVLKAEVEQERGKEFSLREYSDFLKKQQGIQASPALLSHYSFTVRELGGLGSAGKLLSRSNLQDKVLPCRAELTRLAQRLDESGGEIVQRAWDVAVGWARTNYEQTQGLDVPGMLEQLSEQAAQALGLTTSDLKRMQQVLGVDPDADAQTLRSALQPAHSTQSSSEAEQGGAVSDLLHPVLRPSERGEGATAVPPVASDTRGAVPPARQSHEAPARGHHNSAAEVRNEQPGAAPVEGSGQPLALPVSAAAVGPGEALWQALERFCRACQLEGCLRSANNLPLGFMVDIPAGLTEEGPSLQELALMGGQQQHQYFGWWTLVALSEQNTAAGLALILPEQKTRFAEYAASNEKWALAADKMFGDEPDVYTRAFVAMTDPTWLVGEDYLDLLRAVREFRAAHPERHSTQFWLSQGVEPRFVPYYEHEDGSDE